jgi:MFS family permease
MDADAKRIVAASGLRNFAYAWLSIEIGLHWQADGLSSLTISLLFTLTLLASGAWSALAGRLSVRFGRRRSLQGLSMMMIAGGVALSFGTWWPVLVLVGMLAAFSPTGKDVAALLPIEQAALARLRSGSARMGLYAWYNVTSGLASALGALGVAALPSKGGSTAVFWLYGLAGALLLALYLRLSPAVEEEGALVPHAGRLRRSRSVVLRLTALFAVDAMAGGLVVQSIVVLWLHARFGTGASTLGLLFFATNLATALSQLAAPALARRLGLLRTMVFTHLPSNVLLIAVAFAPTLRMAAVLLVLRSLLSQLDVPTRQAYTMALVPAEERGAAAGATSAVRGVASSVSPVVTGFALTVAAYGLPFILAGTCKALYDVALYALFRRMPLEEHEV